MWLTTDLHPQGKDLHDAVLLTALRLPSYRLLDAVLPILSAPDGTQRTEADPGAEWRG